MICQKLKQLPQHLEFIEDLIRVPVQLVRDSWWFVERIGQEILRGGRKVLVRDLDWAKHLYSTQGEFTQVAELESKTTASQTAASQTTCLKSE